MIRNSLICKLINVQASIKENNEKKIKKEEEISKLIRIHIMVELRLSLNVLSFKPA